MEVSVRHWPWHNGQLRAHASRHELVPGVDYKRIIRKVPGRVKPVVDHVISLDVAARITDRTRNAAVYAYLTDLRTKVCGAPAAPVHRPNTLRHWLNQLPDGYRERALASADDVIDTELEWFEHASLVASSLCQAFAWCDSPEGDEFWRAVVASLNGEGSLPPLPATKGADNKMTTEEKTEEKPETNCNNKVNTRQNEQPAAPMVSSELIPHVIEGHVVMQRASDGYVNVATICAKYGKLIDDYWRMQATKDYLKVLWSAIGKAIPELVITTAGGTPDVRGTWVHPRVAVDIAAWCSHSFAVWMDDWVYDWMKGTAPAAPKEETEEKPETNCNNKVNTRQNEQPELPSLAVEIDDKTLRQLIPLVMDNPQEPRVNARHLHQFLQVGKDFSTWINDRIKRYGFACGKDFVKTEDLSSPVSGSAKARPQIVIEYWLSVGMAKELSMVERNAQGTRARRYFISCEEELKRRSAAPVLDMSYPLVLAKCYVVSSDN